MDAAFGACHTSWILVWRFFTRAFLNEDGSPSIARLMAVAWSVWMMWFFTVRTGGLGPLYRPPEPYLTQAIVAIGALWIVFAAALKLGAGVFVPVAEVLASAIGGVVNAGRSATEVLLERMKRDYDPPDRTVPLSRAELSRAELVRSQASLGGDDPIHDDETGGDP